MFAYGTGLLAAMEFDSKLQEANGGNWAEVAAIIILPTVCAICAIEIAVSIWFKAFRKAQEVTPGLRWYRFWPQAWKLDWSDDGLWFGFDLLLTVQYVGAWLAAGSALLNEDQRLIATLCFLALSNATTIPGFMPLIKSTRQNPREEHWAPWTVWAGAYSALLVATLLSTSQVVFPTNWVMGTWDITFWIWLSLLSYPALNAVMHAYVGWLARPNARATFTPAE
jgi:hypothetical protein